MIERHPHIIGFVLLVATSLALAGCDHGATPDDEAAEREAVNGQGRGEETPATQSESQEPDLEPPATPLSPTLPVRENAGAERCDSDELHDIDQSPVPPASLHIAGAGSQLGVVWAFHGENDLVNLRWLAPDGTPLGDNAQIAVNTNGGDLLAFEAVGDRLVLLTTDRCPDRPTGWCVFALPLDPESQPPEPAIAFIESLPSLLAQVVGDRWYFVLGSADAPLQLLAYDPENRALETVQVTPPVDAAEETQIPHLAWTGDRLVMVVPCAGEEQEDRLCIRSIDPASGASTEHRLHRLGGYEIAAMDWTDGSLVLQLREEPGSDGRPSLVSTYDLEGQVLQRHLPIEGLARLPDLLTDRIGAEVVVRYARGAGHAHLARSRADGRPVGDSTRLGPRGARPLDARRMDIAFFGGRYTVAWYAEDREARAWTLHTRSVDCSPADGHVRRSPRGRRGRQRQK